CVGGSIPSITTSLVIGAFFVSADEGFETSGFGNTLFNFGLITSLEPVQRIVCASCICLHRPVGPRIHSVFRIHAFQQVVPQALSVYMGPQRAVLLTFHAVSGVHVIPWKRLRLWPDSD